MPLKSNLKALFSRNGMRALGDNTVLVASRCLAGHTRARAHTHTHKQTRMHTGRWHGGHSITVATESIFYLLTDQVKLTRLYRGNKFTVYAEKLLRIKG